MFFGLMPKADILCCSADTACAASARSGSEIQITAASLPEIHRYS